MWECAFIACSAVVDTQAQVLAKWFVLDAERTHTRNSNSPRHSALNKKNTASPARGGEGRPRVPRAFCGLLSFVDVVIYERCCVVCVDKIVF